MTSFLLFTACAVTVITKTYWPAKSIIPKQLSIGFVVGRAATRTKVVNRNDWVAGGSGRWLAVSGLLFKKAVVCEVAREGISLWVVDHPPTSGSKSRSIQQSKSQYKLNRFRFTAPKT
jgi:hypothetical protein